MAVELFSSNGHACLMFTDLAGADGEAVQANQFLIIDGEASAVIDPGGVLAFNEIYLALSRHASIRGLDAIIASHADPDIVAALDRWISASPAAKVYVPRVWERFVPHFCKPGKTIGRIVGIPDAGQRIRVGRCELIALPAHFLHAEGNFQFYDPVSRILFSGDLGTSITDPNSARKTITSLAAQLGRMDAFHRRYMVSNKVLRFWAQMVRRLPIDMLVPQHGAPLAGAAVREFIDWVETLQCGVDLMTEANYAVPA